MKSYAEIKSRLDEAVTVEYKALQDAQGKLAAAKTNLANAEAEKEKLATQRIELAGVVDRKLESSVDDFALVRKALSNTKARIEDLDNTVAALTERVVPGLTQRVISAKSTLCTAIENFFVDEKAGVGAEVNDLLTDIIQKQDAWLAATDAIFFVYGFSLVAPLARILPRIEHSRVRQFESGNCIHIAVPKPDVRRAAAEKLRAEPTVEMNPEGIRQAGVLRRMFGTKDKDNG